MPGITFLNPAFLGALALAGVPLVLHLIRRRKVRIIPWAAWDFLLQSKRRNRRRLRIEALILLLMRILIVCLAVLTFCRPVLHTLSTALLGEGERVHALIVLDNSYSMGYRRGGATDFERACRAADELLTHVLKQGDSASVVLLSSRPEGALKEPTFDLGKARERVRTARLSDHDTDYGAGALFCARLLKGVRTPTKEVYWITDSQKTGFPETGRVRAQAAWKDLAAQARVTWIDVAAPGRENLSVEAPVFSHELVTPQSPVRIEAMIHNYSATDKNGLLVNLHVDGRAVGSSRIAVPAGGAARASFVYLFEKPGVHTGSVQLGRPDGLPRDDSAFFAARVREKLKVLVVDPHPGSDPVRDEAFYLITALSPVAASEGGRAAIQPTVQVGPRLTGRNLRDYDVVVVTGMTDFAPPDRRALEEFVRNGGGLLLFPGPDTDPPRVNAALGGASFLPARLGARRRLPDDTAPSLNPATINHPVLAGFRDTSEMNLGSALFTLVNDLQPSVGDEATRVLCRFSNGQPAFVERRFGQGKVILAASTAGVSGNTLPYKPAYAPLIHQLVAYLAAGPTAQRNLRLGEPLSLRFEVREAGKPVRLTDPSGETTLQKSTLGPDGVTFVYPGTKQAGLYRVALPGRETRDAFAVNLPPGESDLTSLSERQIKTALGAASVQFLRGAKDLPSLVRRARQGTEIWRALVLTLLPLLFLEALLAQRWGRAG